MATSTEHTSENIVEKAIALAETLMVTANDYEVSNSSLTDNLMGHRPNTLTESYRHGQGVATILAKWQAEAALQAAGLLHSFVYKGVLSTHLVAEVCGLRTAFLCQQYGDILSQALDNRRRGKPYAAKRVKLYIAAYCDPALAFLGVASFMEHYALARQAGAVFQRTFAEEAQEVLIPLLDLLGMWKLGAEVSNQIIQWGPHQQDFQYLEKRLGQTEALRWQGFAEIQQQLQPVLASATISQTWQTPAQIYKPQYPEKASADAFQMVMVDMLVNTVEDCYTALRWIHNFWVPVENILVDHIGISKLNGDRYLRTVVNVPTNQQRIRAQFIIRTHDMEPINQWGLAAIQMRAQHRIDLPNAWWSKREEHYKKICIASLGSLPEIFYVFSPQGQLIRLLQGYTVVDYAYQIHSEVAHQCKSFKVNGETVGPGTVLHHLDLVELEQDTLSSGPNASWLHAARTSRARNDIERYLKRQGQGQQHGRQVINNGLAALASHYNIDVPRHKVEQMLRQAMRRFNFDRLENLLVAIAAGRVPTAPILHPLFSQEVTRQI